MIPQSRSYINTYDQLMRDIDRRLLVQERRTQRALTANTPSVTLVTVATPAEVIDSAVWYFVVSDQTVRHAGTSVSYATWLAGLP